MLVQYLAHYKKTLDVDLRWGITVEQAERGEVLPICLAESHAQGKLPPKLSVPRLPWARDLLVRRVFPDLRARMKERFVEIVGRSARSCRRPRRPRSEPAVCRLLGTRRGLRQGMRQRLVGQVCWLPVAFLL